MESPSTFKHFRKEDDRVANIFRRLQTIKAWLDHSLESSVSEPPWTVKVLMGSKHL